MDQQPFDFWQDHSEQYLKMALNYERRERIAAPDGYGKRTGECGDTVEMFITVANGCIQRIAFDLDGCLNTNACCNTVAELVENQTLDAAWEITPEDIIRYLGTLPEPEHHCAELAIGAFYLALSDSKKNAGTPWKKLYRKI